MGIFLFPQAERYVTMVLSVQTKLLHYIDEHLASYLELWKQLAQQVSTIDSLIPNLAPVMMELQLQSKLLSEHLLSAVLRRAQAPHTLLFSHCHGRDTFHVHELASIAALVAALDTCKNVLGFVPVNIQWLIGATETKVHNVHPKVHLEEPGTLQPDGCIWYHAAETTLGSDDIPILAPGTKGHLCVELEVQTTSSTIDSMHGGVAPDALWRLLWALGTLKDAREDILIEGFYDTLAPVQDAVMAQLHSLPDTSRELAQRWGIDQSLMGLQGFQFHYAHFLLPTCTVSNIVSSAHSTTITDQQARTPLQTQAKAQVGFYLVPDQEPQDIFSKLQRHLQGQGFPDVQVRMCSSSSPLSTPMHNPFVQLALSATEKAYERTPYLLPTTIGSYADLLMCMNDDIPTVFMARNEYKPEEDPGAFARSIKQIVLLIEGMAYGTDTTE
jgi:acetylornithine deacetylase/succinyl-diaminopimelate desuccinylase-like protein